MLLSLRYKGERERNSPERYFLLLHAQEKRKRKKKRFLCLSLLSLSPVFVEDAARAYFYRAEKYDE